MTINNNDCLRDIIVFDTSVILYDSNSIFGFDNHDIVIPLIVLDEVDKFRSLDSEVGRNARSFIRSLKKLMGKEGVLSEGVERLPSGEKLIIKFELLDTDKVLNLNKNDDIILAVCMREVVDMPTVKVSLVTKDISLFAKANVLKINCLDYQVDSQLRDSSQLYTGTAELTVPEHFIDLIHSKGEVPFVDLDPGYIAMFEAYENVGVTLVNEVNPSHTALCLYRDGFFRKLKYTAGKAICSITPQNREQMFAFELMLDPDISLVTLTGRAGSGKTLLAVAAGIHLAVDNNVYDRLLISRPIQPLGKDIGYLPGSALEKIEPYIGPIKDAIEFIFGDRSKMMDLMQFDMLGIELLTYIRGRSISRTLFIVDESQNLTRHEMKTIVSRIGKGSKLILTGDIYQIDNHNLDTITNGLTGVVEKFKPYELAGHVTLTKGQRSELATLAADIL